MKKAIKYEQGADFDIGRSHPPPVVTDQIVLDSSPIAPTTLVAGALMLMSACFQIGYFMIVGIEFLPMLSVSDFAFPAAAIVSWMFIWYPLATTIHRRVSAHHDEGTFGDSKLKLFMSTYFRVELIAFWLCVLIFALWHRDLTNLLRIAAIAAFFIAASVNLAILKEEMRWTQKMSTSTAAWFVYQSALIFLLAGMLYADNLAGRSCIVKHSTPEIATHVSYLRPVGDGHLTRIGSEILFFRGAEVRSISCHHNSATPPAKANADYSDWPLP